MPDKEKKNGTKTQTSFWEEAKEKLDTLSKDNAFDNKPTTKKLLMVSEALNQTSKDREARKSKEQIARERKDAKEANAKTMLEKSQKKRSKLNQLLKEWLKRDTWLIYDEAMPLNKGESPKDIFFHDESLWKVIESCAGHSLKVVNLESKSKQWRVTPFEWVRWLKEKEIQVHPQLLSIIYPKANIAPTQKTAKANNSRELIKAQRQKAIKAFASKASELARQQNIAWSNDAIPVTKLEFLEVFYQQNPAIKQISKDSFDRDIAEIKIKFKRGTKSNKNNMLKQLFNTV